MTIFHRLGRRAVCITRLRTAAFGALGRTRITADRLSGATIRKLRRTFLKAGSCSLSQTCSAIPTSCGAQQTEGALHFHVEGKMRRIKTLLGPKKKVSERVGGPLTN